MSSIDVSLAFTKLSLKLYFNFTNFKLSHNRHLQNDWPADSRETLSLSTPVAANFENYAGKDKLRSYELGYMSSAKCEERIGNVPTWRFDLTIGLSGR